MNKNAIKIIGMVATGIGFIASIVSGMVEEQKMKDEVADQTNKMKKSIMEEIDAKLNSNEKES